MEQLPILADGRRSHVGLTPARVAGLHGPGDAGDAGEEVEQDERRGRDHEPRPLHHPTAALSNGHTAGGFNPTRWPLTNDA